MSNFRFGADDYKLSYYPPEASDGIGGVDWDKVESVEIEFDVYVKERTCHWELEHSGTLYDKWRCSKCGYLFVEPRCDQGYTDLEPNYCPSCGCKVVSE